MRRRQFMTVVGGAAAWPLAARAQQPRIAKLGFVSWQSQAAADQVAYLREGLTRLGYVEGRNIELETWFTDGNRERTQEVIRGLVRKPVDVLIVRVTPATQLAKEATQTIPIVMIVADALATGLVPSLSRPGGNLTGLSLASPDLAGKRLELVREIKPDIRTIAFLGLTEQQTATFVRETSAAAKVMGLNLVVRIVDTPEMINGKLFETMKREGVEAVVVQPVFTGEQDKIVSLAMRSQLPVIADFLAFAKAGALFSLGVEEADLLRRVAYFVDRILKGAKPADLPVEQPTTFRLTVNVRTANALGWTILPLVLSRADEVIE
jgi:putative tryptophan/tyrosine transport system substrate-binding protein